MPFLLIILDTKNPDNSLQLNVMSETDNKAQMILWLSVCLSPCPSILIFSQKVKELNQN